MVTLPITFPTVVETILPVPIEGIDISHWDVAEWDDLKRVYVYKANWAQALASTTPKIRFIIIKATHQNFPDPVFTRTMQDIANCGLPLGAFHWLTTTKGIDGKAQANTFIKHVSPYNWKIPPMLDMEDRIVIPIPDYCMWVTDWVVIVNDWFNPDNDPSRRPLIYTNKNFWDYILGNPAKLAWLRTWTRLVVASYGTTTPTMPAGWKNPLYWQYTDRLAIPGLLGGTDGDKFMGTEAEFTGLYGTVTPPPPPAVKRAVVTAPIGVRVRTDHTTFSSSVISTYPAGKIVNVYEEWKGSGSIWVRISPLSQSPQWMAMYYNGQELMKYI